MTDRTKEITEWFAKHLARTRGLQPTMAPAMESLVKDVAITFEDVIAAWEAGYDQGRNDFL